MRISICGDPEACRVKNSNVRVDRFGGIETWHIIIHGSRYENN